MSAETITALCTGIVSILGAFGAMFVSIRNGQKQRADAALKDDKLQALHILVNGQMTQALTLISQLRGYIAERTKNPADIALAKQAGIEVEAKNQLIQQAVSELIAKPK